MVSKYENALYYKLFKDENKRLHIMEKAKATTKRNKKGRPENWEISIIKGMLEKFPRTEMSYQDILAFFTRPTRSLNHRVIGEIGRNADYTKGIARASDTDVDQFIKNWPHIDGATGLSITDDELVIKSREAMLLAVQSFNNPKTYFRSEVFIVLAIIAWTYLMHAFYKQRKVDYRQKDKNKEGKFFIKKTKYGAERYWEVSECLQHSDCTLDKEVKDNITFLSEIRDEVEHRMTTRIDKELSLKFQLCCIYYNSTIKSLFGEKLGLDKELSIALQFSAFNTGQNGILVSDKTLPKNIQAVWDAHKNDRSPVIEAQEVGFFFKRVIKNHPGQAGEIIEFMPADGSESATNQYMKYVDRKKYRAKDIVQIMHEEGFKWFRIHEHTKLWQNLDARNPSKNFGIVTLGIWGWYDIWLEMVRQHCKQKAAEE